MPVIRFDARELERLLGKKVPREDLIRDIPMIGADVDHVAGDDWAIEFFPDRPDLYTVEGIARALRQFYGVQPGLRKYKAKAGRATVHVDAAVKDVRPHIVGAFVRGVDVTEKRLEGLIELQEDLHWGLGARRRKVAIGVHDAAPLKPPFWYTTVAPDGVSFVPLQETRPMTPREILAEHPKGKDYAHLLAKADRYPIILDSAGQVVSLPPIINGTLTTVTTRSKDLFLDVTGTDAWAVSKALNLLATSLAEAGGTVETVKRARLKGPAPAVQATAAERLDFLKEWRKDAKAWESLPATPDFTPEKRTLRRKEVTRLLGEDFTAQEIKKKLERMGFGARAGKEKLDVEVPCYRVDVMHEWDLIEDVAIGHGINAFTHLPPAAVTIGKETPGSRIAERARASLVGLGFLEIMSLSLSNPTDQFERMGLPRGWSVDMKNALSEDHSLLRVSLLPSLLNILKKNAHRELPQRFFEVGIVTREGANDRPMPERRVAGVVAHAKANFSEAKGLALALARDLAWNAGPDAVRAAEHGAFVPGRLARLDGVEGVFGEVHPRTIEAFGLGHPVIAFEFALGAAGEALAGPAAEWR